MTVKIVPAIKKLVTIEEGTLIGMSHNAAFLAEFPFLKSLANYTTASSGCGTCGGAKSNNQKATVFTAAKATIASMGDDKKRKLKELLNAEKVRMYYREGSKLVQRTF